MKPWTRSPNAPNSRAYCRPSRARTPSSARGAMPSSPGRAHSHRLLRPRRQGHAHPAAHAAEGLQREATLMRRRATRISAAIHAAAAEGPAGIGGFSHRRISDPPPASRTIWPRSPRHATWSRSACRSPTRWPMAPPSSAQASPRLPMGSRCRGYSRNSRVPAADAHGADPADELFESAAELRARCAAARSGERRVSRASSSRILPFEESDDLKRALDREGLALVQMVTPVTPPERLAMLCREAQGFVYAVTMTGTTGRKVGGGARRGARLHGSSQALLERPGLRGFRHPLPGAGRALRGRTSTAWWSAPLWWSHWSEARMSGPFWPRCARVRLARGQWASA